MGIAHRLKLKIRLALACLSLVAGTVEAGEKADPKSWAFQTPVRPPLPAIRNKGWVRNPIDSFVLARLEDAGLTPAPESDRIKLIRRLSFDLTGLPLSPREVEAFVRDSSVNAYEKLVDRLLASPQYGERWALFWLDLARFAESDGFKADDSRPTAWRYRDYVIRSLNSDKPYDRFVREQLAGDELWPDDADALIATGFNRHYPYEFNAVNLEQRRQETLNDITDTTTQAFLGLTVGCARCHDHKFDPILQEDYYRVQAFFAGFSPCDVPVGSREEIERYRRQLREWEIKTAEARKRMSELEEPYRQKFAATRKARFPKEYQAAYDMPAEKRTPLQQQLAVLVARQVETGANEVVPTMKPEVRKEWQGLARQLAESTPPKPEVPLAMAFTDIGAVAPPTFLLRRGEWRHRDREVAPGFLSAMDDKFAAIPAPKPGAKTAGRRNVLAEWLTRPDHPLTPRVMVNRLWQHHFGRGIVATPNDFGSQGDPPSHPELLDWFAREFVARGWSLKAMHRLMVTSATYRQSSGGNSAGAQVDPENRLLWRMNRRRLEGETLRDAMLGISGRLNLKAGGPSIHPELPPELRVLPAKWPVSRESQERERRSIYVFVKRNLRYPLFSTFDAPDRNETCARRHVSTNAPQALTLLNDQIILNLARAFAGRVLREAGSDPARIIEFATRLAVGRLPDANERTKMLAFLAEESGLLRDRLAEKKPVALPVSAPSIDPALAAAVVDLCHALLNLNEFLYVD